MLYLNFDLPTATRFAHRKYPGQLLEPEMPPYEKGVQFIQPLIVEICNDVLKPAEKRGFDTIVVDTVGELYRRWLEEVSNRVVRPTLSAYGDVSKQVERFCRFLCEAPINVVLVCHEMGAGDGEEREKIAFTGTKAGSETLSNILMSMVDIIAYTGVKVNDDGSKEFLAQLVNAKGRQGGDRFDCLGNSAPLDLSAWIDRIAEYEAKQGSVVPESKSANVGTEAESSLKLDFRKPKGDVA